MVDINHTVSIRKGKTHQLGGLDDYAAVTRRLSRVGLGRGERRKSQQPIAS